MARFDQELSLAKNLFLGHIIEENIFPFPVSSAGELETLSIVLESIDRFMAPRADLFRHFDADGFQDDEFLQSLRELGLFGLIIPEEAGGVGLSNSSYSRVMQQLCRYDASTSLTIGAHSSIGMKGLLLFGTEEQKARYLPRLASGELIAAFCLTEAGAGSDAASIRTTAAKNEDGSWTLNGEKIWITNGAFADFFTVFARTESEKGKMTAFIVERAGGGVESGPKEDKLGIRASATTTVRFDNVRLPAESVLGGEGMGFKVAMSILNNGRTGLGGGCVGAMKQLIDHSVNHAASRKQFGKPVADYGLVKEKIARMTINCFTAESVVAMIGHYIDSGSRDFSVEAAMGKVYSSEALWQTVNDALQIAGGSGYMREYPYERVLRDARINMIFEGTNEILRLYIALSGMKEAGDYLKGVEEGVTGILRDPIKGFGILTEYATRRFSHLTTFGRDRVESIHPVLRDQVLVFEKGTHQLAVVVARLLRRHRKNVVGRQFAMKRLADSATDIFVGLCTLSRVTHLITERGEDACDQELKIARVFAKQADERIEQNLSIVERSEDDEIAALSDAVVHERRYRWDTI